MSRQARVRGAGLAAVILLAGIVGGAVALRSLERPARALLLQPATLSAEQLHFALYRVGLEPPKLAACGLSGAEAAGVVEKMHEHLLGNPGAMAHDALVGQSRTAVRDLEHRIRSGQGTAEDIAALPEARANLAAAVSSRDAAHGAMFTAATADLAVAQRQVLSTIRANAQWSLPIEFLAIDQAEPERVQLRDALANEKISAKTGEEPDPEAVAYLQAMRSELTVAVAKANLDSSLPIVQTAWDAAVAQVVQP